MHVRTGAGKSRIVAQIASMALKQNLSRHVIIVFCHPDLKERDEQIYKSYFTTLFSFIKDRLSYVDSLNELKEKITKDCLVILDEADLFIYDQAAEFKEFQQTFTGKLIALTGTPSHNVSS